MGESTRRKSIDTDTLMREIIGTTIARGKGDESLPMTMALSHVPMNWRGRRESTNVQDLRAGGPLLADLENVYNRVMHRQQQPRAARAMFPIKQTNVGFPKPSYPPTQFAPSQDRLIKLIMEEAYNDE